MKFILFLLLVISLISCRENDKKLSLITSVSHYHVREIGIIRDNTKDKKTIMLIDSMRREDLKTYSSLRDAIIDHNNYFTPLDTSMLYIDSIVNELKRK